MIEVTLKNIDEILTKYNKERGGETNEETDSEAMFLMIAQYRGIYILNTGLGPVWIGVQNATARWSNNNKPFQSVKDALIEVLIDKHLLSNKLKVIYSDESVDRLRWMADRLEQFKSTGEFLSTKLC